MDATGTGSSPETTHDGLAPSSNHGEASLLSTALPTPGQQQSKPRKTKQKCRFYMTKKGCRAGEACPFSHDFNRVTKPGINSNTESGQSTQKTSDSISEPTLPAQIPSDVTSTLMVNQASTSPRPRDNVSRAVVRPTSTMEVSDPRGFQISQIKRRFASSLTESKLESGSTILHFRMSPSDPDFPFEMDALECSLKVPSEFPKFPMKPSLRVKNKEMERGFQINVERGFDNIWTESSNMTLLNAMKLLDKRLESLLVAEKVETIKIVANKAATRDSSTREQEESSSLPVVSKLSTHALPTQLKAELPSHTKSIEPKYSYPEPVSPQRRQEAASRRESETQILEHRLGRLPQFSKSSDGTIFTIPIEPRKRSQLPLSIQSIKTFRLFVPASYDIDPCTIQLEGVNGNDEQVKNVEAAFLRSVKEKPTLSLLAHVNTLTQNIHTMAAEPLEASIPVKPDHDLAVVEENMPATAVNVPEAIKFSSTDDEKSHIRFISRPPEWMTGDADDGDDTESSFSSSGSDEENDLDQPGEETNGTSVLKERGVMMSFPHLELYGIELLELEILNLSIKCERCKEAMDVRGIKNNEKGDYSGMRSETCRKCAFSLGVGYRKDMMHASSIRAGYLDLDGCTVVDMLPSSFIPTCADCSTPYPAPGVVSVRGETSMTICRECHRKLTFRIPETKYLDVGSRSAFATAAASLPRKKKQKENLGIVAGQELPRRGRCSHYAKSHRWFRFSCCAKVYPCDKCHDAATDHPNEFANRMICGYCSREQNYRPENCVICHSPLTGKKGTGFWEGGKGTRDRARMSRKDPRKYKMRHATTNAASTNKDKEKEKGKAS